MGIESDQLVFDYLSRVGDLAQQRQLSSAARMRLVADLRGEIDRRRAKGADSPAAVRRILDRIGTPEELVSAAADPSGEPVAPAPPAAPPEPKRPRLAVPRPRLAVPRLAVPRPRKASGTTGPAAPAGPAEPVRPAPEPRPAPPHLAGTDELGDGGADLRPDWWRVERVPLEGADAVPGFVGGVEIPEMLRRPPRDGDGEEAEQRKGTAGAQGAAPVADPEGVRTLGATDPHRPGPRPSLTKGLLNARKNRAPAPGAPGSAAPGAAAPGQDPAVEAAPAVAGALAGVRSLTNPVLLLAALALVVGAVIGNWFALGGGWVVAWFSRKLSSAEKKAAVIALPALAVAGGVGWLWGRAQGKWGEPIAKGEMNAAIEVTWPWIVRIAAVASALFLVWRSQRTRPE
ncbi:hypothetical protein [Streptomyces longispororuber]|uniref:hypothetical protein n=1 Tax=Streptomyces longispororuber TaxID=68230 RepID=UPI0036F813B0